MTQMLTIRVAVVVVALALTYSSVDLSVVVVAVSIVKGDNNIDCGGSVDGRYGGGDGVDKRLLMMI